MKKTEINAYILIIGLIILALIIPVSAADTSLLGISYYNGSQIDVRAIGPGLPPATWKANTNLPNYMDKSTYTLNGAEIPTLLWSYGCSATSATMLFGYYDRNGYTNMYTGPTDGGFFPLTNAIWGSSQEGNGQCPLSASQNGLDGRTIKGHVDDYYSAIKSTIDPYYTHWTEHSPQDSVGDFMGTNQYQNWRSIDGATWFYNNNDGSPLSDFTYYETTPDPGIGHVTRDGAHGMKLFANSRGYTVTSNYNQYIYGYNGNTHGFTYAQYKAEIDAGYPVLIQLDGHTMLGVGYSGTNQLVVHDTWDYVDHTMTWGGSYGGMAHMGVTVFHLGSSVLTPVASFTGTPTSGMAPLTVTFTDTSTNTPTSWLWNFGDSSSVNATVKNPVHTYASASAGTYTVSLTATNAAGSNTKTSANYITVIVLTPVTAFTGSPLSGSAPLTVQFTDASLNTPTGWAWFFGDENYTAPWTQQTASAGWSAREGHSSVVMPDGSIVLMGGEDSYGSLRNDVWRSTDNGVTWTQQTAGAGWSARTSHTSVAMPDGSIVLMGGNADRVYGGNPKNDTWRSTDKGATWTQQTASAGWSARRAHSSVVMPDGSIVLMGGAGSSDYKNDTWRSTDNGATWTQVNASAGWSKRWGHSSVVMPDGSIVLMGGNYGKYSAVYLNDTWRSTDKGATWTQQTASAGWSARTSHSSVAMPDGSIILMGGGADSGYKNDVWRSTDNGMTWTQLTASAGWSARTGHTSVVMPDGSIVLMGGGKNDVWRFMPVGSSARNPSHTYTATGIYQVALQAYNTGGYNSIRKTGYITVSSGVCPLNGDLNFNGILDSGDTTLLMRKIVGLDLTTSAGTGSCPLNGDLNFNGILDSGDTTLLMRKIVGLDP